MMPSAMTIYRIPSTSLILACSLYPNRMASQMYIDFFPTPSNSAFETEFGSVHNGVPFRPQRSESKYTDMNRKILSL